ncbi:MAG: alanine racemase [Candidatus Aquicultor sp.]
MLQPSVSIDLAKIQHNARVLTSTCNANGIEVVGVVKACLGNPDVAGAMVAGGVSAIADSRLQNLERLLDVNSPRMMLRQPMTWEIPRAVEITDMCLVSEIETIKRLSATATALRKEYKVIVMVEAGDLREGVLPGDLLGFMRKALRFPWIRLGGIGSNVACLQGVSPTPAMLELLVESAADLRERLDIELPIVSGGNSSIWKLIEAGTAPPGVNQARLGEAILLGQETVDLDPIPHTYQDAIILEAEILEIKEKPTEQSDGLHKRVILAIGLQDICRGALTPLDIKAKSLRRSSDHLVVDVTESEHAYRIGDAMTFIPGYEAMLAAMTSPFIAKSYTS